MISSGAFVAGSLRKLASNSFDPHVTRASSRCALIAVSCSTPSLLCGRRETLTPRVQGRRNAKTELNARRDGRFRGNLAQAQPLGLSS